MARRSSTGSFGDGTVRGDRLARLAGRAASLTLALALVMLGGAGIRLSRGPIALDGWVVALEAMANEGLAGSGRRVLIGGAQFELGDGPSPAPGVYATDVVLHEADGTIAAAIPSLRLGIRPFDLLTGSLRLSAVTLHGATLRLVPHAEGGGLVAEGSTVTAPMDVLAAAVRGAQTPMLSSLRSVALEDTRIVLPLPGGGDKMLSGVRVALRRADGGLVGEGRVPLPDGGAILGRARMAADGAMAAELLLDAVRPAIFADWHPALAPLAGIDAPLGGTVSLALDAAGRFAPVTISAALGPGTIDAPEPLGRHGFDTLALIAALDVPSGLVRIEHLEARSALGYTQASGEMQVVSDTAAPQAVEMVLALGETGLPVAWPAPGRAGRLAVVDGGTVVMRAAAGRIELADLFLRRGTLRANLGGRLALTAAGWEADLLGQVRNLSARDLVALWPPDVADGARNWVAERVQAGVVEAATVAVSGPLHAPGFALTFGFRDAVADPLPPMPPLAGQGWGQVSHRGVALTLEHGSVEVPGAAGGTLALDGSVFTLDDIETPGAPARIAIHGSGPIGAALTLIDTEPLGLLDRLPLDLTAFEGAATVVAQLSVPLRREVELEDVGVTVETRLADLGLALDAVQPGLRFEAAALALSADTQTLALRGEGQLDGTAVSVDWQEVFSPAPGAPRTRLSLSGGLDPARLGISPPEGVRLAGPLPVSLIVTRDDGPGTGFAVEADLAPADIALAPLRWHKPEGGRGTLRATGRWTPEGTQVDSLAIAAGALALDATLTLDAGGGLIRLGLDRLRIGDATDLAATLTRARGGIDATITGARLDASALIEMLSDHGQDLGPGMALGLRFTLEQVALGGGRVLSHAVGQINRGSDGSAMISASGAMGGAVPVSLEAMQQADGNGQLSLRSSDAGGLLRAATPWRRATGGQLHLEATLARTPAGLRLSGDASLDGIIVGRDGALDQLLEGTDLDEALERLHREGIRFDRVRVPFQWHSDRLSIFDAHAYGPTIGLTITGDYALDTDRLDMHGVFTPQYGLNSLVGNLPLLGPLLTGGTAQGVIAFTFGLSGPTAEPVVSVNPLSVLLPGVLRNLVRPRSAAGPG